MKQSPGTVTQLSNSKLTKRITKPNVLLYTAEGPAVWLSLQNTCIVNVCCVAVTTEHVYCQCMLRGCHYRTRVLSPTACILCGCHYRTRVLSMYAVWLSLQNTCIITNSLYSVWLSLQNTCIVTHNLYAMWLSLQNTCIVTNSLYSVWLSLQNTCIVTHNLYAVCPRKTVMTIRDTDFNPTINFLLHSTEPPHD